jgi:hypothetical protein
VPSLSSGDQVILFLIQFDAAVPYTALGPRYLIAEESAAPVGTFERYASAASLPAGDLLQDIRDRVEEKPGVLSDEERIDLLVHPPSDP